MTLSRYLALFMCLMLCSGIILAQQGQWFDQVSNTTRDLNDVEFSDANHGFIAGDNGTVLYTQNGGTTWALLNTGISENLTRVCVVDSMTAFVFGAPFFIYGTTDAGTNWFTVPIAQVFASHELIIQDLAFTNDQEGYIVGSGGFQDRDALVFKTIDRGVNWTLTNEKPGFSNGAQEPFLNFENNINKHIFRFDDQSIYLAGQIHNHNDAGSDYYAYLAKSVNSGDSFSVFHTEINGPDRLDVRDLDFPVADTGFALIYDWEDGFRIMVIRGDTNLPFFTASLGEFSGPNPSISAISFTNTHEGFVATAAGAFIIRDVFGFFPDYLADSLHNPGYAALSALDATPEGNVVYFVGPGGTIQKYQKPDPPTSVQSIAANSRVSVRAFPVPANDQVSFEFKIPESATGMLSIYDSYGRVIARETITNNRMRLDTSKWAVGIYTYQLQSESFPAFNGKLIIRH